MSRVYTMSFAGVAVTAVQDLLAVYAGANMAFRVHEVELGQTSQTTIQNLRVSLRRVQATVTSGSGGAAGTINPVNAGDAAATVTGRTNDTVQATSSASILTLRADVFNPINGYQYLPPDEDRIIIRPGQALSVSLDTAPGASMLVSGTVVIEELF